MKFVFQNNQGTTSFNLQENLKPKWSPFKKRVQTQKRYGRDGSVIVGDERVDARVLTFSFKLTSPPTGTRADRDLVWSAKMNEIIGFFDKRNSPFFVIDTDIDRRALIALSSLSDSVKPGEEKTVSSVSFSVQFIDAYWEDNTEQEQINILPVAPTPESFSIDNDSDFDSFVIFEIVPTAFNSDFHIRNETTGDAFTIGSNDFDSGTKMIIDSREGTIILDNGVTQIEISHALADGSGFMVLRGKSISNPTGTNNLKYESVFSGVKITSKWRRRFPF